MAIRILDSFGNAVTLDHIRAGKRDATAFEIRRTGAFRVKASDLGNGHLEVTASRQLEGVELEWSAGVIADHLEMLEKYREDNEEELRQRAAKIAANRAKRRIRHLCKANGADTLLTLTYRANETDLARVKADLKEFNRRVLRVLPDFGFIAAFEEQKRGAWHVHAATARIPRLITVEHRHVKTGAPLKTLCKSYDLLRQIWRGVAGERGGNVDVARSKRSERSSMARIAAYLAKYATKAYAEGDKWTNRWTRYGFKDSPAPVDLGTVHEPREAIECAYALLGKAHVVVSSVWSRFGDWLYLAAEKLVKRD